MAKKPSGRKEKLPLAPGVNETPGVDESWSTVLTSHIRQGSDLDFVVEDLVANDDRHASSGSSDRAVEQWLAGQFPKPARPWAVCVRLEAEKWVFVGGPQANEEMARRVGKRKKLRTLRFGFDSDKKKTFFRSYTDGKFEVDFQATGRDDEPLAKVQLKSKLASEKLLEGASTPKEAIAALLAHYDAQRMCLQIAEKDSQLQLLRDGNPLSAQQVTEIDNLKFYPLLFGENPASDRLYEVLSDGGSLDQLQQAIEAGADLRWSPMSNISPLTKVILNKKGPWEKVVAALVKAGAPIEGEPDDEPPLLATCTSFGTMKFPSLTAGPTVKAIELLLDLGANINVADPRSGHERGWAVLHRAINGRLSTVVKYLVSRGADIELKSADGRSPLDLARFNAEHYHGEAKIQSAEIVQFLSEYQAGLIKADELRQTIAVELLEAERKLQEQIEADNMRQQQFLAQFTQGG